MLTPTTVASFDVGSLVSEQGGKIVTMDKNRLPADVSNEINRITSTIKFGDSTAISNYGTDCQKNISGLSSNILATVKTKDTAEVGTLLTGLVKDIRGIDVRSLSGKQDAGFIANLFHKFTDPLQTFMIKQKSVGENIATVAKDLDKKRTELLSSVQTLDKMYLQTVDYFKSLQLYIVSGFYKLEEERAGKLVELETKANETKDQSDVQNFIDYQNTLNRFEKRLHDMVVARHVALLQGPQIRQMQHNNTLLAEEIQNSILNAIPAWQQQMVLAIEAYKSKKALESQKLVKDAVNDILKSNSELLKQTTIEVATMAQETLIEFDTVVAMQDNLLAAIDQVKVIEEEGRKKRESEVQQLIEKEAELKGRMVKA